MNYTEQDVMKDPNGLGAKVATKEFIGQEIVDMANTISCIEQKTGKTLVGERSFLDKPYQDCKGMTNMQVVHFFSVWKSGIFARVNGVDLKG